MPSLVVNDDPQPLLRLPVFAPNTERAEEIIRVVRQAGGYAERWYRPVLFPGVTNPQAFGIPEDRSGLRVTDSLSAAAVCLPTEVSVERIQRIVAAIHGVV